VWEGCEKASTTLLLTRLDTETITAYIGIGSNLGDRAGNLLLAVRGLMEASFTVTKLSGIYETEPVEIESESNFLNMVAELRCESITPSQMMARMLRIEYLLGRKDKSLKKPRTIDLDLLFYNHEQTDSEFLTLPHPRLHLRNFVLVPMSEIAASFVHPILRKDIKTLLAESIDPSAVARWNPNGSGPIQNY
ncbi:MAG: 2-amino-4-hydroxy-6-hydroxymethyldihydropteridine diphosphokinase, partial [Pyrinomonadaceae bacterium]